MESETKPKKKKLLPLIFGSIIIVGLLVGISKYTFSLHHEETDDAQVDADISPVIARVTGYIEEIRFEENKHVNKGDTLLKIDDHDLQIKVSQAKAAYENAKANVEVARANTLSIQANLRTAKASTESARVRVWKTSQDFRRYENLLSAGASTVQQYDASKAEKQMAEAQLDAALKQESAVITQIASTEKQVAVAQSVANQRKSELDYAILQLSYSTVISPATGIVCKKNAQTGQLVNAGSPLCAVVSDSNLFIVANFKETQLEKMAKDEAVEVVVDAFPKEKLKAKIGSISAATGAKFSLLPPDNATGNFVRVVQRIPVKIFFTDTNEVLKRIRAGMSAKVTVTVD